MRLLHAAFLGLLATGPAMAQDTPAPSSEGAVLGVIEALREGNAVQADAIEKLAAAILTAAHAGEVSSNRNEDAVDDEMAAQYVKFLRLVRNE